MSLRVLFTLCSSVIQILHFSILALQWHSFNTLSSKNNTGGCCLFTVVLKGRLLLTYLSTEELVKLVVEIRKHSSGSLGANAR